MTDTTGLLCIGGPCARRRYTAKGHFLHVQMPQESSAHALGLCSVPEVSTSHVEVYERRTFHTPDGDISVWVPEGQTSKDTMMQLLATYESSAA